jgi:predicted ATPase
VPTIAAALGFTFAGRQAEHEQLCAYLADKRLVLVLDNFEHLLDGAPLLPTLLAAAPGLSILATSRQRLGVSGEQLYLVDGLAVPPATAVGAIDSYAAVRLFLQAARRTNPDFAPDEPERTALVQICRAVAGMPLGIELAAAWVRVLSCAEIAAEIGTHQDLPSAPLRDTPTRHHSLRAVFEHSWAMLPAPERVAFTRLAVFRGGFSRAAAEALLAHPAPCAAGNLCDRPLAPLALLAALLDSSLIRSDTQGRFEILETLRQYGLERLVSDSAQEQATRDRHSRFFADMLAAEVPLLRSQGQRGALERIGIEIENVRTAWLWMVAQGHADELACASAALGTFYEIRGWFHEGLTTFGQAAERLPDGAARGLLLTWQGRFAYNTGDYERAGALLQRAQELLTAHQDKMGLTILLSCRGLLHRAIGNLDAAEAAFAACAALCEELGYTWGIARTRNGQGILRLDRGDYQEAGACFTDSLAAAHAAGDEQCAALALSNLGVVALAQGRYQEAEAHFSASMEAASVLGDKRHMALAANNLGITASRLGRYAEAKRHHQESVRLKREIGERGGLPIALNNLGHLARVLGDLDESARYLHEGLAVAAVVGDKGTTVRMLSNLGLTVLAQGNDVAAARYFFDALSSAVAAQQAPLALSTLVESCTLLTQRGQLALARDVLAFARQHPACEAPIREQATAMIGPIDNSLGEAERTASDKRAAKLRLHEAVTCVSVALTPRE